VTAAELMTKPAVTIGEDAPVAAAARLMQSRKIKRLPVVDDNGRLRGIITRTDVLSVFERPGTEIRDEVIKEVIAGEFGLDPELFVVTVASGIVTVTGSVERRADALSLLATIRHLEGVIGVRDRLSYRRRTNRPPGRNYGGGPFPAKQSRRVEQRCIATPKSKNSWASVQQTRRCSRCT
jgi:CBS-domain-containing membrane protein